MAAAVHSDVRALGLFRIFTNEDGQQEGREYRRATFADEPHAACALWVSRLERMGMLTDADTGDGHAVLDLFDASGDIIQDYEVTADGFRYLRSRLQLAVVDPPER